MDRPAIFLYFSAIMAGMRNDLDLWSLPAQDAPRRLEAALVAAETALGVTIAVRDHAGLFLDAAGEPVLPPARIRHERRFCNAGRDQAAHDQRCLDHCFRAVPAVAATAVRPFVHRCWKGGAEIVVPIRHEGAHVCTLFAGIWASDHPPTGLPPDLEAERQRLRPFHGPTLARLAGPLTLLGAGLIATWLQPPADLGEDRGETIRRFLRLHLHEPPCLADLARHLGLSASRASHVVRETCGASFQDLLLQERIRRAQALLRHSQRPVRLIAERLGFHNEYYFNRAFSRLVGVPPGRWRKQAAAS